MGAIQTRVAPVATGTSSVVALAATAASSALVLGVILTSEAPTEITDSAGGTLTGGQWVLRMTGVISIYDRIGAPAGITSVTAAYASATGTAICFERDDLISYDKSTQAAPGTTTTPSSGAVATTGFANEVGFGIFFTFTSGANSYAAGSGWTAVTGTGITGGAWNGGGNEAFAETQVFTSTGTPAATATCASSFQYAAIATYRQTAGGGGGSSSSALLLLL